MSFVLSGVTAKRRVASAAWARRVVGGRAQVALGQPMEPCADMCAQLANLSGTGLSVSGKGCAGHSNCQQPVPS